MTRRDYILIQDAIRNAPCSVSDPDDAMYRAGLEDAATAIADALSRDNPRFDRDRFLKAAGVQPLAAAEGR